MALAWCLAEAFLEPSFLERRFHQRAIAATIHNVGVGRVIAYIFRGNAPVVGVRLQIVEQLERMHEVYAEVQSHLAAHMKGRYHAAQAVGDTVVLGMAVKHAYHQLLPVGGAGCALGVVVVHLGRLAPPLAPLLEQILEHVLYFLARTMQQSLFTCKQYHKKLFVELSCKFRK